MFSLEPATVTNRFYPELFQQGETAFAKPIVDGQHPHDFIMELAAMYDLKFGVNGLLSFYVAPVGDPGVDSGEARSNIERHTSGKRIIIGFGRSEIEKVLCQYSLGEMRMSFM